MEAPDNRALTEAIAGLLDASAEETERFLPPFLHALLASRLITGDRDGPSTAELDGEAIALALFTDIVELHFFDAGSPWTTMSADDAIRAVAEGEYDGMVINPRGRAFELTREEVLEFFDVEDDD